MTVDRAPCQLWAPTHSNYGSFSGQPLDLPSPIGH